MNPLPAAASASSAPDLWFTLIKTVAMLSLVLGVLLAVLYLLKRMLDRRQGPGASGIIRMVASFYLAPRQRVVLLEVAGETILIGVSPQHITCLSKINAPTLSCEPIQEAPEGFMDMLRETMRNTLQGPRAPKGDPIDDDS
jgi:flagellar protein FliO/FliZ